MCSGIILAATLVPKGAFSFNPKQLNTATPQDVTSSDQEDDTSDFKKKSDEELGMAEKPVV